MQKYFLSALLVVISFLVGCSGSKDKLITADQLKTKIAAKLTTPSVGEEIETESIRVMNQGYCKYLVTQNKQIQFVDQSKMDANVAIKYDLITASTACQRLPSESKTESSSLQLLKSQFMTKIDNLTNEALFVNQVSTARNAVVQSLKEEKYKNQNVATVVVQYIDTRDNRFYKYSAAISMDSYLVGVFDIKIQNLNGEIIDQTNLTHVKLNNPVVNYP